MGVETITETEIPKKVEIDGRTARKQEKRQVEEKAETDSIPKEEASGSEVTSSGSSKPEATKTAERDAGSEPVVERAEVKETKQPKKKRSDERTFGSFAELGEFFKVEDKGKSEGD